MVLAGASSGGSRLRSGAAVTLGFHGPGGLPRLWWQLAARPARAISALLCQRDGYEDRNDQLDEQQREGRESEPLEAVSCSDEHSGREHCSRGDKAPLDCFLFAGGCAGRRGGGAVTAAAGMPVVTVVSSAQVRPASAWPTRASSSSLSSRPSAKAVLSVSITCSRSACDTRRRPRPAAAPSSGPVLTRYLPGSRCPQSVARLLRDGQARSLTPALLSVAAITD